MLSKYKQYHYWESLICKEESLWENPFGHLSLTRESIFLFTFVMDQEKNIIKQNWSYCPDIKSLLGFLEYVFLPTAFFTWLDRNCDGFYIPMAPAAVVLDVIKDTERINIENEVNVMKRQASIVSDYWNLEHIECKREIKKFAQAFNHTWTENNGRVLYFDIFADPAEIAEYIFNDEFIEVMEEEFGMSREQWQEISSDIYDNPFMKQKFIHILNNKLPFLV
jgi:hypothetical protein